MMSHYQGGSERFEFLKKNLRKIQNFRFLEFGKVQIIIKISQNLGNVQKIWQTLIKIKYFLRGLRIRKFCVIYEGSKTATLMDDPFVT